MVGSWIPVQTNLLRRREIQVVAEKLGEDPLYIAGLCVALWGWASEETEDGFIPGATTETLVRTIGGHLSAWDALISVGWLLSEPSGLRLPKWDRWLSNSAKARLGEALGRNLRRGKCPDKSRTNRGHHLLLRCISDPESDVSGQTVDKCPDIRTAWLEFFAHDLCGAGKYQDAVEAYDRLGPTAEDLGAWKLALKLAQKAQLEGKFKLDPIFTVRARMLSYAHPKDASLDFWIAYEREEAEERATTARREPARAYSTPPPDAIDPAELTKLAASVKPIASGRPLTAPERHSESRGSLMEHRGGQNRKEGRL